MLAILPGDTHKVESETSFKVKNLDSKEPKVMQDGVPSGKWKPLGDGEIQITTTVDHHTFVIR
jgi:hypothetical protein